MRRALTMAGAQNMLMTLWDIADEPTVAFMDEFYQAYGESEDPKAALIETQRNWLVKLREDEGLAVAVYLAGPFVMSSRHAR